MKKILTIALLLIALTSQAQISDELTQDTIDLWIVPGCTKCITAAKMLSILTHINDNKLHKDSLNLYASPLADTSLWDRNESSGQMWNKDLTGEVGIGTVYPATALDVVGTTTTDELDMQSPLVWMDGFRKRPYYMTDFLSQTTLSMCPWSGNAVSSGTSSVSSPLVESHIGINRIRHATTTNSGYYYNTGTTSQRGLFGDESTNLVCMFSFLDSVTTRFGFHDATTITAPVDGAYIEIGPDSVLTGKTMSASSGSTTGTSYTLALNTWYRFKIKVNSNATRVDYYVYNDAGTVLWSDYLTTNIPGSGKYLGHGIISTKATNGSATGALQFMIELDYMDVYLGTLVR